MKGQEKGDKNRARNSACCAKLEALDDVSEDGKVRITEKSLHKSNEILWQKFSESTFKNSRTLTKGLQ